MYPRIYNSYYKDIKTKEKPNFKLRIFFSGSIVKDGYENFNWRMDFLNSFEVHIQKQLNLNKKDSNIFL